MKKLLFVVFHILILNSLFWCTLTYAQDTQFTTMFSPKLNRFIIKHTEAYKLLTNTLSEAFSNRTVQLYYFYSEDEFYARSFHYYPNETTVGITIRENQQPIDEFACLIFESINSENEKFFQKIAQAAIAGSISKTNFVLEIFKQEFTTAKITRNLLKNLKPSPQEISTSYSYKAIIGCPDTFEDFLVYKKKVSSPKRDQIKEYEAEYDSMQAALNKTITNGTADVQTNSFEDATNELLNQRKR